VVILVTLLAMIHQSESSYQMIFIFFLVLLIPLVILVCYGIIQQTAIVILVFASVIKTTPDGIEMKYVPFKHIRCAWSEVDRIGKYFLFYDAIYLKSYEVIGLSLSLKSFYKIFQPSQGFITLSGYIGWPDGQLAMDLKQYAPGLFECRPESETASAVKNESRSPDENKDDRLLIAISHISILLSTMGLLLPIIIYAIKHKESSNIGFQALQALIWQITAFTFGIICQFGMVLTIFIPILFAKYSENTSIDTSMGLFFIIIIVVAFVLILINLLFVVFGIIGAIKTYQGKDYRYPVVGHILKKYQPLPQKEI
jgi:uncharacterized Tic20 family protein